MRMGIGTIRLWRWGTAKVHVRWRNSLVTWMEGTRMARLNSAYSGVQHAKTWRTQTSEDTSRGNIFFWILRRWWLLSFFWLGWWWGRDLVALNLVCFCARSKLYLVFVSGPSFFGSFLYIAFAFVRGLPCRWPLCSSMLKTCALHALPFQRHFTVSFHTHLYASFFLKRNPSFMSLFPSAQSPGSWTIWCTYLWKCIIII